jgi:small conductance mechanosensitive channel
MPQSLSQLPRRAPAADTTRAAAPPDTNSVASGLGNINSELGRAISLFLEGDFQGMYRLLYENAINVLGLFLENGLKALLAFAVLYVVYKAVDKTLDRVLEHSRRVDAGLQGLLQRSFRVTAYVFIGSMVLGQLGVNVTALVAGLSIAGIVAGFAARDSLENFISGVTILVDQPFKVGDYIVVEDQYGQVDEITLRSTRIRTVRNEVMVLPNTQMITQPVVNHTKQNTLRVDIEFGIAYKEYPEEARAVLLPLVEDDDRILPRPEPTVVVTEMADSAVSMVLRMYLRDPSQELAVRWDYTERVREALREADIEIPFPHRQLFLDEAKAFADTPLLERPNAASPDDAGGNDEA